MLQDTITLDIKIAFGRTSYDEDIGKRLISWWTNSDFYHAELVIEDYWISSSPVTGGVSISPLRPLSDKWEYHTISTTVTATQYHTIMEWVRSHRNDKYDNFAIAFSAILPLTLNRTDRWFCSEIVVKILQLFLVKEVLDLTPHKVTPGDLARLFKVKE